MAETKNISCRTSQPPCNLLLGYTAGYDRASNRLYERALHAGCRSTLFESYDSADRLRKYLRGVLKEPENDEQLPGGIECPISLRDADQERTYGLDGVGNWQETAYTRVTSEPGSAEVTTRETTQVREHDKVNQIENLDHDANGNLLGDGTHRYRYDVFNRLREVRNMAGQLIARYGYDAMDRRIRKAVVDNEEGESVRGTTSRVESVYDSLGREVRQSQTIAGRAYAVTQAEFRSYVPTKTELPNGRVIECGYDALYRKQSVGDASSEGSGDAESIAEWWFVGPGRIAATRLGNNILCSQMNNAMDRSAVQADAARPDWGDACTDHLGYDGVGRLIGKRYLSPAAPPKKMAIQITDATPIAGRFNRWEYKWRKVIPTGEGGFRADSDNITQDSEGFGPGYNTMEANNAELGVQGSGDNVSGLPESVELMPIGKNAVILDAHVVTNCVNEIEVHFSAPNNLGGSCETQE